MAGRAGWVEFGDESPGNPTDRPTAAHGLVESSSAPAEAPPSAQNAWVLFNENPWHPPTPPPQVKATRHSVCSTASFWSNASASDGSWTGQSEQSISSNGSGLSPADPVSLVEDEGRDVDTSRLSSGAVQTQTGPSGGLNSWVTFEDDQQATHPPVAQAQNQTRQPGARPPHPLRVVTPNGSGHGSPRSSSVDSGNSCSKKNPFLSEAYQEVKPSCINPFTSFFDGREEVKQRAPGPLDPGSDAGSPVNRSQIPGSQGDVFHHGPLTPQRDEPGHPSGLQVSDTDRTEDGGEALRRHGYEEVRDQPYLPSHMLPQDGWPMLLRIPEKKNIMSSRHWGPIHVRLCDDGGGGGGGGVLRLFYERGLEKPFRSLRLTPQHQVSEHRLQSYEDAGRVHTLSLELPQYRERRRSPAKLAGPLQPAREQLIKLATSCYHDYLSFRHALGELLSALPAALPAGALAPAGANAPGAPGQTPEEELQVEVRDEFYGEVAEGDGRILKQLVITRVHVLALFSGPVCCRLGLNDVEVQGKELVSRQDIVHHSTNRWIPLRDPLLHAGHADAAQFLSSRAVAFTPPPRCRFQLLRFCTPFAEGALPFSLRTVASLRAAEVCVQSWLLMSQGFAPNLDPLGVIPCENVVIRYPIPEIWAKNFRREGVMGEKSLKARFNKGASFGSAGASGAEPAMRVTLGAAKYEQAFNAVVWRIPQLPDKNSALGHPHTFFCRLELGSDQEVPRSLERHLEVEFDMPAAAASSATIRSLSVDDRTDVKKWISYKSHFFYQVPVELKRDDIPSTGNQPVDKPGECSHQ